MKRIELKVEDKKDYKKECVGMYLFYRPDEVFSVCVIFRDKAGEDRSFGVKNIVARSSPFIDVMDQVVSFLKSE